MIDPVLIVEAGLALVVLPVLIAIARRDLRMERSARRAERYAAGLDARRADPERAARLHEDFACVRRMRRGAPGRNGGGPWE